VTEHETAPAGRAVHALRVSYNGFCEAHTRAWFGLARARLHDDVRALRAVERMKASLWEQWPVALRQRVPAAYAWSLVKSAVADAVAEVVIETGRAPGSPLADRAEVIRHFARQARLDLEEPGDHDDLFHAMLRLTERQCDVVVLRYLLGLKDSLIAEYLDVTESNVRTTAHQAVRKLRRLLGVDVGTTEE
jgi:RNA polymerase sigma factor (sigma-70 family)